MTDPEQDIQENPTQELDFNVISDQTLDEKAFNYPLLGKTLADGAIEIGGDSNRDAIAIGGFAVMYRGRLRPVQLRWNQTMRGERDPIGFGVRDSVKGEDGKWTFTEKQLEIAEARRKEIEAEYAESDDPEQKELDFLKFHEPDFKELHSLDVAVKVLRGDAKNDSGKLDRFRREYHIGREILNNPHITKCLELVIEKHDDPQANNGEKFKEAYIVFEFVDGIELTELKEREEGKNDGNSELAETTVLDIMRQTLEGVIYAHEKGVIHRDLKPSNILLIPLTNEDESPKLDKWGNQKYFVKIIDYGVAKATSTTTDVELTKEGACIGTPFYMSPEQAAGEGRTLAGPSDIYSLGSTFYRVLTGKLPFIEETPAKVVALVESGRSPEPMRRIRPEISPKVEDLILGFMAKERTQRFGAKQALKKINTLLADDDFVKAQQDSKTSTRTIKDINKKITTSSEDDNLTKGCLYARLADLVPRIEVVPRTLRGYSSKIQDLYEALASTNVEKSSKSRNKLDSLFERLDKAISNYARKIKSRQYYLELAATCFEKAPSSGNEKSETKELADIYHKEAVAERFRIRQLIEREQKPAGLVKRMMGHPATWVAAGLFVALSVVGGWHGFREMEREDFFNDAQASAQKAKTLFENGDLEGANSEAGSAYKTYDLNLPKRYNEYFEKDIDKFKLRIAKALEDARKEKVLLESLARVDGLIKTYEFRKAKRILDTAAQVLTGFKNTPYRQLAAKLESYTETVIKHQDKIKDKEDDIDDLDKCVKKVDAIRKNIKKIEDGLALDTPKFFPKKDYEILLKKIGRYKIRLDYDVVRKNVNPKEFDTTFFAYLELEKITYNKLLLDTARKSGQIIDKGLKDISAVVTYLSKDYSVDDGMAKTAEISNIVAGIETRLKVMGEFGVETLLFSGLNASDCNQIKAKLNLSDAEVEKLKTEYETKIKTLNVLRKKIRTKADLKAKLKTVQNGYAPVKKQVEDFDKLKKAAAAKDKKAAAELGIFYFNKNNHPKAEELMKIADGEESVKPYLTIFDLERRIEDPKNITYRVLAEGYSSDDLSNLNGVIKTYKEKLLIDQAMMDELKRVNAGTIMSVDIEKLKEKHTVFYHAVEERENLDETKPESKKRGAELDASIAKLKKGLFAKIDNLYSNLDLQIQKQKPMARPELITQLAKAYEDVGNKKKADQYYSLILNSK